MVEDQPEPLHPYIPPPSVKVDTTIAARMIEEVLRKHFRIPDTMDGKAQAMSKEAAQRMKDHFLHAHRLYWSATEGNA